MIASYWFLKHNGAQRGGAVLSLTPKYDVVDEIREQQHPILQQVLDEIPDAIQQDRDAQEEFKQRLKALREEFKDKAGNLYKLVRAYNEARERYIQEVLAERKQGYCHGCRQLRPSVIIELTGVEKRAKTSKSDCSYSESTWVEKSFEVKYLCYACREDENWEQETEEYGFLFSTTFIARMQDGEVCIRRGLDWQPITDFFDPSTIKSIYAEDIPQKVLNELGVPYKMKTELLLGGSAIAVCLEDENHNTIRLFESPWKIV